MSRRRSAPETPSLEVCDDGSPVFLGSYVRMQQAPNGCVFLEVGDNCVVTLREAVPVGVLAAVLTAARDKGFAAMLAGRWDPERIDALCGEKKEPNRD